MNAFHILNGDALAEQFPIEIQGARIVARECLVDGNVQSDNLDELFEVRSKFISTNYPDYSPEDYYRESVPEFNKIVNIPNHSEINLWFEDDLFCQVNFWFVTYLLLNHVKEPRIFLVRPKTHTHYGFGGLNQAQLKQAFEEKTAIQDIKEIADLWKAYQSNDQEHLKSLSTQLTQYPFIEQAVYAHIDRIPSENDQGRPKKTLREIMNELNTKEFGLVFREFCKRESIYGFGDLQVKRLFDELKNE